MWLVCQIKYVNKYNVIIGIFSLENEHCLNQRWAIIPGHSLDGTISKWTRGLTPPPPPPHTHTHTYTKVLKKLSITILLFWVLLLCRLAVNCKEHKISHTYQLLLWTQNIFQIYQQHNNDNINSSFRYDIKRYDWQSSMSAEFLWACPCLCVYLSIYLSGMFSLGMTHAWMDLMSLREHAVTKMWTEVILGNHWPWILLLNLSLTWLTYM